MDGGMQYALNRFPDREVPIRKLWAADEDFRDLCHDYALCREALACWPAVAASQTQTATYRSLCRRLELEIEIKTEERQFSKNEL